MELRNLKYFVVVAEEMNFRRASDRLHVAQSAVSRRIQDLEVELGVQLFEREGKRMESMKPHVPPNVVLCQIEDLQLPTNSLLIWRCDNRSPPLHHYVTVARSLLSKTRQVRR